MIPRVFWLGRENPSITGWLRTPNKVVGSHKFFHMRPSSVSSAYRAFSYMCGCRFDAGKLFLRCRTLGVGTLDRR